MTAIQEVVTFPTLSVFLSATCYNVFSFWELTELTFVTLFG